VPPNGGSGGGNGGAGGAGGAITGMNCFSVGMSAAPVVAAACQYLIPDPPCSDADRLHIGVLVGGVEIPKDATHTNGWDYVDPTPTAVEIYGPKCDAVDGGAAPTVVVIVFKLYDTLTVEVGLRRR